MNKKYMTIFFSIILFISLIIIIYFFVTWKNKRNEAAAYIRAHKSAYVSSSLFQLKISIQYLSKHKNEKVPNNMKDIIIWIKKHDRLEYDNLNLMFTNKIDQLELFYDQWDNPIQVIVHSTSNYSLISYGPNKKNENGKGDDIVISFDPFELW